MTRAGVAAALLCAVASATARPAAAGDGVVELDQTRALAGSVTPGDAAGFPVTLSQAGSYRLTGSLVVPAGPARAVEIAADDVTLDLAGFSIVGPGGGTTAAGVYFSGRANVEVRDGAIEGMGYGIDGDGRGHRARGLRVTGATNYGIRLTGDSHQVEGCSVVASETGISTAPGSRLRRNSVVSGTGYGLLAGAASLLVENTSEDGETGIYAGDASVIAGCSAQGNSMSGIGAGNGSSLVGNAAAGNSGVGLAVGAGSVVSRNSSLANGIGIYAVEANAIRGNAVASSAGDGIQTRYGVGPIVDNSVSESDGYGIRLLSGVAGYLITGNVLRDNLNTESGGYPLPANSNLCDASTTCP